MTRVILLLLVVAVAIAQSGDVRPPALLTRHRVWSARDQMFLQVRIVPDSRIRTIALEAWELEQEPDEVQENGIISEWMIPQKPTRLERVRYSREDVAPKQAVYGFTWRGLDRGNYELQAVVVLAGGRTLLSQAQIILVR